MVGELTQLGLDGKFARRDVSFASPQFRARPAVACADRRDDAGLWVAVGFGSNGVMSGPHAGRLVGEAAAASAARAPSGRWDFKVPSAAISPGRLAEAVDPCREDGVQRI